MQGAGDVGLIEEELDRILVCLEEWLPEGVSFLSWSYNVIPLRDRGADAYRVVITGVLRFKLFTYDFIAVAYVAMPSEDTASCVELELFISNGRRYTVRPEVLLDKCLKRLRGSY